MVNKIFITILTSLFALLSLYNNYATAESCDDVYIVYPGNSEGGTFYLSLERDAKTKMFPRAGYIQAMTLIRVVKKKDGSLKEERLSEEKHGTRYPYVEFVSSDGSFGYIKRASIAPMTSLLKYKNHTVDCTSPYKLVIPISPIKEVILFKKPNDRTVSPKKQIGKFSRSSFDIVLTDESLDYWDTEDHTGQIPFYIVTFSQKREDGTFLKRDALVKAEGEGKIYRLLPINPESYQPVRIKAKEGFFSKIKRFFSRSLGEYDSQEIARGLNKSCDEELSVEAKVKLDAELPFKIIKAGAGAEAKYLLKYDMGYRYSLHAYHGFASNRISDVLKTIRCEENSTSDWYAHRLTVTGIGENKDVFEVFQHQLERRLKDYFEKPDTTGIAGIRHEEMVALKKFEKGSGKDYFTAFSKLDKYLDERFFNKIDLTAVEKLQFKCLIIRLIVDCR